MSLINSSSSSIKEQWLSLEEMIPISRKISRIGHPYFKDRSMAEPSRLGGKDLVYRFEELY